MPAPSALVIGAGIAGLAAAWRLHAAGFAVRVLEAAAVPGGRMGEATAGPIRYNTGARLVYPFGAALHRLVAELGLQNTLVPIRGLAATGETSGRPYRIELLAGPASLRTPGLSWVDRLRLAGLALAALARRGKVDPDDLASDPAADAVTLAAYLDARIGPRSRRLLVDPVFRGARAWNPDQVSAAFLTTTLPHLVGQTSVYAFAGGMGRLPIAIASRLPVSYGRRVWRLAADDDGVTADLAGETVRADLAVCAVPGVHALGLLAAPTGAQEGFLSAVRYNPVGIVHFAVAGDLPPMMRFLAPAESAVIGTYQNQPAGPDRPAQIFCQLTPEASADQAASGTQRLQELAMPVVRRFVPDVETRIVAVHEQWIPHKIPMPVPGYALRMAAFRARQEETRQRIYFCGDYLAQALATGAAASGERTAAAIVRHWGNA